jgi:hypothetical protein
MNLLGAVNYDPAGAVSKVTTSLLAMTAFDTTNLRIAFTVPSHGMVTVKMTCVHHGSTTTAQVLLGCLEGATLRGRAPVTSNLLGTAVATTRTKLEASFTITGLTPGAVNWDAAYGVEIVSSANGAIKYGGPNDTTTDNAFGGFNFEIWDPRPLPTATPGAANGVFIAGTNAATTITTALTTTFTGNLTGSVGSVTGAVGSVTGNVGGSVASVTTVNGLAANVITAASMAADASAEIADAVWDEDATGHQTQGTFGQAIGDPVADTNTIYKATVTDAAGVTVGADTTNALTRLPAALSGDGFMKADLLSIGDELVSGYNATLKLKALDISNNIGPAISAQGTGANAAYFFSDTEDAVIMATNASDRSGLYVTSNGDAVTLNGLFAGLYSFGGLYGIEADGNTNGVYAFSQTGGAGIKTEALSGNGHGFEAIGINAPQDIALPSGDLDDQLQALPTAAEVTDAVWDEATAGHTTAGTTGKALTDAGAAGDPWGTTLPGAYGAGTAGKIIGDNINATVSSRATQTSVDDLPTNAELTTALGTADDATLAAIAALNNLSSAQVQTAAAAALTAYDPPTKAELDAALDAIPTAAENAAEVLSAATTNPIDANVQEVNDVTLTGDGSITPWGPA